MVILTNFRRDLEPPFGEITGETLQGRTERNVAFER
jgi:hypothetical protein